jgi:hypothetical protein
MMAKQEGGVFFVRWRHNESVSPLTRHIHKIVVQGRNGLPFSVEGPDLPDEIITHCGTEAKGKHMMEILMSPGAPRQQWVPSEPVFWPRARDVVHMVLGAVGILLFQFMMNLVGGQF